MARLGKGVAIVKDNLLMMFGKVGLLRAWLVDGMTMPRWMGRWNLDFRKNKHSERFGRADDDEAGHELAVLDSFSLLTQAQS